MTINLNYTEKEVLDYLYKQMTEEDVQVFEAEMLSNPELKQQVSAMTLMLLINEHPRNLYPVSAPIDDDTRRFVLDIIKPPPSFVPHFPLFLVALLLSGLLFYFGYNSIKNRTTQNRLFTPLNKYTEENRARLDTTLVENSANKPPLPTIVPLHRTPKPSKSVPEKPHKPLDSPAKQDYMKAAKAYNESCDTLQKILKDSTSVEQQLDATSKVYENCVKGIVNNISPAKNTHYGFINPLKELLKQQESEQFYLARIAVLQEQSPKNKVRQANALQKIQELNRDKAQTEASLKDCQKNKIKK